MRSKRRTGARLAKMRVFIVEDHPIVRHGLTQLINQQNDLKVCGQAADGRSALELIEAAEPDIAIVDVTLQKSNGLVLIKNLRVRRRRLPVLVLSIHDESLYAERVLRAGARGYLMKQEAMDNVLRAIRIVLAGKIYLSDVMQEKLNPDTKQAKRGGASPISKLSDRELEVYRLLGKGQSCRQIAADLCVAVRTIETHRDHIRQKMNLKSGREVLQHAIRWAELHDAG